MNFKNYLPLCPLLLLVYFLDFQSFGIWLKNSHRSISTKDAKDYPSSHRLGEPMVVGTKEIVKDTVRTDKKKRKIAWLLSFPNSGTSFTGKVIRDTSQRASATNYGAAQVGPSGETVPLDKDHPDGPYWVFQYKNLSEPEEDSYILTKTHCAGRCSLCSPDRYIQTHSSFLAGCLKGNKKTIEIKDGRKKTVKQETWYQKEIIGKAVHLFRNPFDNIVSRFHLEVHEYLKRNNTVPLPYMNTTKEGFLQFCKHAHKKYESQEHKHWHFHNMVPEELKSVPCYADFFRWVQWHNMALVMTKDLEIPTHYLHYESFGTNFEETVDGLVSFLEMSRNGVPTQFQPGKSYLNYFKESEIKKITKGLKKLALSKTWELIHHYFE